MRPVVSSVLVPGVLMGGLLMGGLLMAGAPLAAEEAPRTITVTGSSQAEVAPDRATITAGVETQDETAAGALAANSKAMAEVFKALAAAGVAERDMQTSQLALNPVYEPFREGAEAPQKVVAYQASNMVTVTVRDVAGVGAMVDALAGAGANRLYGIGFDVTNPRPALDAARKEAVADARARAELFAGAAGVKLGPVVTISEQTGMGGGEPFRAKAAMDAMAAPVAGGSVTLTADVVVVYGIE